MKRKIISLIFISVLLLFCFSISALAATESKYFDMSDIACGGCGATACPTCDAYIKGYDDGIQAGHEQGYIEGGTYYQENILPLAVQAAIGSYKESDEYKAEFNAALLEALEQYKQEFYNSLTEAKQDAIDEYKSSQEFIDVKNEQYAAGEQAGLQAGLEQGEMQAAQKHYEMGYTDGKYSYTSSQEFENQLQSAANYGYEYGYNDGLEDGSNRENDDGSLLKIILSVMISLAVVILVFIVLSLIIKKVKRKKKK